DIFFSIGAHPGFALTNHEEYEIHFEKKERGYFRLDEKKLVNFRQLTAMESTSLSLKKELFEKDAMIFKDLKSRHVDLVNIAHQETIRLNGSNTPYFVIWGKESLPFICLEPWYGVSDDQTHDQHLETKPGIQTLAQGGTFR